MSEFDKEVNDILLKIFNKKRIVKYTEYPIKNHIDFTINENQELIKKLNRKSNVKAYYNYKTLKCDSIGTIDVDGDRIIDFNDDFCDLMDKGLDFMVLGDEFK